MLKGKKIYLRSVEKRDVNIFYNYSTDKEIRKFDGGNMIFPSIEYVMQHFDEIMNVSRKTLSIINEKSVLVGYLTYKEFEDTANVYTIGITIGSQFWGRGYGQDAIMVLLDYLFMYRGAQRVELEVVDYNLRAIRCYEKCGFITEGKKRSRYFSQGKYHDTLLMGILRDEFDKLRLEAIN